MIESWVHQHNRATPFGWYCKDRQVAKQTGLAMEYHPVCPLVPKWWNLAGRRAFKVWP